MEKKDIITEADGIELYNDVYREIGTWLGQEVAIRIFDMFRGQQISFPTRLYDPEEVRRAVRQAYDGTNVGELARRYGYSEKSVRRMLAEKKEGE